jgi:hypothetical protein
MKKFAFICILILLLGLLCGCFWQQNTAEPEPEPRRAVPVHDAEDEAGAAPAAQAINWLNGEKLEEPISARPYAVVIDNASGALPAKGVSAADLIFEFNVEGNMTRFLALFQDIAKAPTIGPVRSCRSYDVSMAIAFDAIYTHAGGSPMGLNDIIIKHVADLDAVYGNYKFFFRDKVRRRSGYAYEHTLFADTAQMIKLVPGVGVTRGMEHLEDYEGPLRFGITDMSRGSVAQGITVYMNNSKITQFDYSEEQGKYLVSEYGLAYLDANTNEQVAVDNVLALFVNYSRIEGDEYGRLEAELTSGTGYYAKGGRIIELSWVFSEDGGLVLMHPDGRELRLTAGSSFICCPDSGTGKVMASYDVNK